MLLHGWGGAKESLFFFLPALEKEFRVSALDLYGFGQTPHPDHPLTLRNYAEGVVDFLNEQKMQNVILIGHSFGGKVALEIARRWGHLIDKVVLLDASGMKPRRGIRYRLRILKYKISKRLGISIKNMGSSDYRALSGVMKRTFINVVNTHLDKELKYITPPVLLVWGRKDKDTPLYMAKRMLRRLPNARLVVTDGGHFAYLEQRAETLSAVKNFLGGEDADCFHSVD